MPLCGSSLYGHTFLDRSEKKQENLCAIQHVHFMVFATTKYLCIDGKTKNDVKRLPLL